MMHITFSGGKIDGQKSGRLQYIDNIRVFVIVLVILMHLAVTYSGFGSWYYNEGAGIGTVETILFGFFQSFLQAFFMGLLFLISGYFVPAAYDRKGFGKFLKDRLIRLVIPGVVYMVIINPLLSYYLADFLGEKLPGFFHYYSQYMTSVWVLEGSGPMWFVLALFLFNMVYAFVRLVRKNPSAWTVNVSPKLLIGLGLLIALLAFLIRIVLPIGTDFLNMQLCNFAQYILLFVAGIIAYRGDVFSKLNAKTGKRCLILALGPGFLFWAAFMILGGALDGETFYNGGLTWQSAAFSVWESMTAILVSYGLLTLFREKFNTQGKLGSGLSKSAFATYMFHPPIIIVVCLLLRPLAIMPIFKFLLTAVICVPLCFAIGYFVLVRIPGLKKIL